MKKKYDPAELEIILFGMSDVITASTGLPDMDDEDTPPVGGGGYESDGWL